ncbi:uncharacterized protein FIBRA_04957 [Fibroporia radiculosa]|uniref:Uncharacterized protein n=1 Tax=Fibroporia radiculosa TaxID=599839 RepID=J4GQ49_9APHY|nr:uncharacterized protein FIBRA_04957 [Fibroporia radiculosa]CCM02845.1 predicted protein [Fibroporia radiculosa]
MSRSAFKRIRLPKHSRPAALPRPHRLHTSAPRCLAGTFSPSDIWDYEVSGNNPGQVIIASKLGDLRRVLLIRPRPEPNRVWGSYLDLLTFLEPTSVPLEVHQAVLRYCTPPAADLRLKVARSMNWDPMRQGPHLHETRFQAVIRNIRSSGCCPTLEDYHFVLEQFAAVGHHLGAMQVLNEMSRVGLQKTPKTYGLCLQALCHRLTLPCWDVLRPQVVSDVTRLSVKLLREMEALHIPFTSLNVDLAIRIMKETLDLDGFAKLMKGAYGIDLSYPDRPPLELWDKATGRSKSIIFADGSTAPDPMPFSTAALNTAIDMLGRLGEVSKLVQTFEVLTTPLPPQSQNAAATFDEDEDDEFGYSNPRVAPYPVPSAEPNTSSYHMLLKWISRAGNASLARHYLLQAINLDKRVNRQLRRDCLTKPREELIQPTFGVNRSMLVAVFGLSNRDKNLELMRWVRGRIAQVAHWKENNLQFYKAVRDRWSAEESGDGSEESLDRSLSDPESEPQASNPASIPPISDPSPYDSQTLGIASTSPEGTFPSPEHSALHAASASLGATPPAPDPHAGEPAPASLTTEHLSTDTVVNAESADPTVSPAAFSTFFSPSTASEEAVNKTINVPRMPYFDVDLDAHDPAPSFRPKPLDMDVHIEILEREVRALQQLRAHVVDIVGRTTQRVKERLGRRVWAGKDVYLRDKGTRIFIARDEWRRKVNFSPRSAVLARSRLVAPSATSPAKDSAPHLRPGSVATTRGLMTSAADFYPVSWSDCCSSGNVS